MKSLGEVDMGLVINGTDIPTNVANALKIDNTNITEVIYNGTSYWKQQLYSGPASGYLVTTTKALISGVDFPADTPITFWLLGGGAAGDGDNNSATFGGLAGASTSFTRSYAPGVKLTAAIGAGGVGIAQTGGTSNPGGVTSIDGVSVPGGVGCNDSGNSGKGGLRSTLWGNGYDGTGGSGGRSSGASNGGNKGTSANNYKGFAGGVGSGGGGGAVSALSGGGSGGRGQIRVIW